MSATVLLVGGPSDGASFEVPANYEGEPYFILSVKAKDGLTSQYLRRREPSEDGSWEFIYVPARPHA